MMDYLAHWSLLHKPFAHDGSRRFFCGVPQLEFIAGLNRLSARGQRCAVLSSSAGCGTTTLLKQIAGTSGLGDCAVEMVLTQGDQTCAEDVFRDLARALCLPSRPDHVADRIQATISATGRQSVRTLWMVDRCGVLAGRVARDLTESVSMLSVVLASSVTSAGQISTLLARNPRDAPTMRLHLGSLSLTDTGRYVRHSLHLAGGASDTWSDAAIARLHDIGQGRLATMSATAELAMWLAAQHRVKVVVPEIVEAAQRSRRRAA